jgi:hypothetical protein
VVGFVLVLAVLVTYFAYVARSDVPRWGADAERSWDQSVGDALSKLDRTAAAGLGTDASATGAVPPAPSPRAFDIPLMQRTQAAPPTGSLAFLPDCGGLDAIHVGNGTTITDLADGAHGCLVFREQGTYAPSYGYRTEFGGLLRTERDRAFIVSGPPLELKDVGGRYVVAVTFLELRGASNAAAVGASGVSLDLVAGPSFAESGAGVNAASASWTFHTPYPSAWQAWYASQIATAGFDPNLNYACDASLCPALASNEVQVVLGGPDASASNSDLALSISYGRYDVTIR